MVYLYLAGAYHFVKPNTLQTIGTHISRHRLIVLTCIALKVHVLVMHRMTLAICTQQQNNSPLSCDSNKVGGRPFVDVRVQSYCVTSGHCGSYASLFTDSECLKWDELAVTFVDHFSYCVV